MLQAPDDQLPVQWSVAELRALLDAAVDAIVVIDEFGRINAFNPAAERLFGYEARGMIGQRVELLMPEPYHSEHADYVQRYLTTGEARIIGIGREVEGRRANGEVFPMYLSVGEARDGTRRRFVGIIRDLSAQKAAESNTRSLEARLTQVGRQNLVGEMAAGVAHEINQPLSAIATYAEAARRMLGREHVDMEAVRRSCERIAEQALRASQVIANLRRFARQQDARTEVIEVNELVVNVMNLIEADAKSEGIAVTTVLGESIPQVHGDRVQLQLVLLNLTHNAVDAMRDGLRKQRGIRIETSRGEDGSACIDVIDHGHGVPASLSGSIFHPFVTTKVDGLGVGLAISRSIVEACGGTLKFRSNDAGGAIFEIALPGIREGA
jgi:two-component system, LuxR family, sensor kinase FixL